MKYIIESPTNSSISFDSRFSFSNLNDETFMTNFKKFKKESLTHLRMFAPAKDTLTSIPAQLIGTETVGTEVKNNNLIIRVDNDNSIKFSHENTIFGRLKKLGLTSSILSSALPYCSMLPKDKNCIQANGEWYKGIVAVFPLLTKIELFFESLDKNKNKIHDIYTIQTIKTKFSLHSRR